MMIRSNDVARLVLLIVSIAAAIAVVESLPQVVSPEGSKVPCSESSCTTECEAAAESKGENVTITQQCQKSTGICNCCILPDCEVSCQQRRRKERPRSKEVRSRCTEKGECYCNFIFFAEEKQNVES